MIRGHVEAGEEVGGRTVDNGSVSASQQDGPVGFLLLSVVKPTFNGKSVAV